MSEMTSQSAINLQSEVPDVERVDESQLARGVLLDHVRDSLEICVRDFVGRFGGAPRDELQNSGGQSRALRSSATTHLSGTGRLDRSGVLLLDLLQRQRPSLIPSVVCRYVELLLVLAVVEEQDVRLSLLRLLLSGRRGGLVVRGSALLLVSVRPSAVSANPRIRAIRERLTPDQASALRPGTSSPALSPPWPPPERSASPTQSTRPYQPR